jgi:hypothetical protein
MLDKDGLAFDEEVTRKCITLTKAMLTTSPEKRASVDLITVDPWVTMHRFAMCEDREVQSDTEDRDSPSSALRRQSRSSTVPAPVGPARSERGSLTSTSTAAVAAAAALAAHDVRPWPPDGREFSPTRLREPAAEKPREPGSAQHAAVEHRGEAVMKTPRKGSEAADGEVGSPRLRQQREKKERERMLPSLPVGRRAAGGAGASAAPSWGRRHDVSPLPASRRSAAHK